MADKAGLFIRAQPRSFYRWLSPLDAPGIQKLSESCDLIITGAPLERAWQMEDSAVMQATDGKTTTRVRTVMKRASFVFFASFSAHFVYRPRVVCGLGKMRNRNIEGTVEDGFSDSFRACRRPHEF